MNRERFLEDKENMTPTMLYNKQINNKSSTAPSTTKTTTRTTTIRRRGFGTLLQEAHQEMIEEIDEQLAVKSQCKDIYEMVNRLCVDFEREDKGLFVSCFLVFFYSIFLLIYQLIYQYFRFKISRKYA